ncbi:MAG: hypothetical protein HYY16_13565 [Planctomycetes bacterium]|nr:hypothetical protein [Planctomycetota bacterium]
MQRPQAQAGQPVQARVYGYHGDQPLVSRVDEVSDLYAGTGGTEAPLTRIHPYPTPMAPEYLIAIAEGSAGIRRIRTSDGTPISVALTAGRVQSGVYVNAPPLKPHYFVGSDYPTANGSTAVEFYDPNVHSTVALFVPQDTDRSAAGGAAFCKTTDAGLPGVPYYRWFWTDLKPAGSSADSLMCIDLREEDIRQSSTVIDPWNPTPDTGTVYGPPFPSLSIQMTGPTWREAITNRPKFSDLTTIDGYDLPSARLAVWTDTAGVVGPAGHNYLLSGTVKQVAPTPPQWGASLQLFDADSPTFPLPALKSWSVGSYDSTEVFHDMKVIGNYLIVTAGKNGADGRGGSILQMWWIPDIITAPNPNAASRFQAVIPGVTGIGSNPDNSKLYFGTDNKSNRYYVAGVVAAAANMTADANPPITTPASQSALTQEEAQLVQPPDRKWPGQDWVSFYVNLNPVETFPGTGTGIGRRGKGGACSTADADPGPRSITLAVVGLIALIALALATLREAARHGAG